MKSNRFILAQFRRATGTIIACIAIFCGCANAMVIQCTTSPIIQPFSTSLSDVRGVNGYVAGGNQQLVTLESVQNGVVKKLKAEDTWKGTGFNMIWMQSGNTTNTISSSTPTLSEDGYLFNSGSAVDWVYKSFSLTIELNQEIKADSLQIRVTKKGRESSLTTPVTGFTLIPAVDAQWDLPDTKDIGEIPIGETMTTTLPGPTGTSGSVRGLETTGAQGIITINGCGEGCTAQVDQGFPLEIKTHADVGTQEGEYGLKVEATLLCD